MNSNFKSTQIVTAGESGLRAVGKSQQSVFRDGPRSRGALGGRRGPMSHSVATAVPTASIRCGAGAPRRMPLERGARQYNSDEKPSSIRLRKLQM